MQCWHDLDLCEQSLSCYGRGGVIYNSTSHLPSIQCWHDLDLCEQSLSCYGRGGVRYNSTTSSALHAMLTWFGPVWTELVMLWQRWCDLHVQLHHVICPPCNVDMIWSCMNRACHVMAEVVWSTTPPVICPPCNVDMIWTCVNIVMLWQRWCDLQLHQSSALHTMLTWFGPVWTELVML